MSSTYSLKHDILKKHKKHCDIDKCCYILQINITNNKAIHLFCLSLTRLDFAEFKLEKL